eukprot:Em0439g1a
MKAPKVGDRVQVAAAAAKGKKLATQRYGANAKVKKLSGEIIASESSGRRHPWRVRWNDVNIGESVHSSKVLENAGSVEEIEDYVVMAEHDSDEELPAEELAEAEPEMEEGGEPSSINPLVVKGIKWTIVDNLVDTRYIPKQLYLRDYEVNQEDTTVTAIAEAATKEFEALSEFLPDLPDTDARTLALRMYYLELSENVPSSDAPTKGRTICTGITKEGQTAVLED